MGPVTCLGGQCEPRCEHCALFQEGSPGHATGPAPGAVEAVSVTVSSAAVPGQLALLARVGSLWLKCLEAVVTDLHISVG